MFGDLSYTSFFIWSAVVVLLITTRVKPFIIRMQRNGSSIIDHDGWEISFVLDSMWIGCFGAGWRKRYYSTWAVGCGHRVWFYFPKGHSHAAR